MTLRCVSFPNSISGAVSGANAPVSVCELIAMMVLALFFAATNLECGPAPLEHGLVCGLALVGLGPRWCAATPFLPFAASVGVEFLQPQALGFVLAWLLRWPKSSSRVSSRCSTGELQWC